MSEELAVTKNLTPMEMIQVAFEAAVKQGAAAEMVTLILDQQRWLINHNEEEAFNAALKRIQKRLKTIPKHGWNPDTKSKFATAEDIDSEIQHLLDDENMALSFRPAVSDKPDEVLIIGTLSLGAFTKEYPLPMPADGKGPKGGGVMSRTHATGSAITYGKRYLKNMIFDLRFAEIDDDGNGADAARVPGGKIAEWMEGIRNAPDMKELKRIFGVAYTTANELGDRNALDTVIPAYENRKTELANAIP